MRLAWPFAILLTFLSIGLRATPPPDRVASDRIIEVANFDSDLLAREIFRMSNEVRVKQGLDPLKPNAKLTAAGAGQAGMLALRIHSGHDNPLANHGDPYARILQEGLPAGFVGENAATLSARNRETSHNYTYAEMAAITVQAWMDSPGHRANLLNPAFRYLGCGTRAAFLLRDNPTVYSIQNFYTPAPRNEPLLSDELNNGGHIAR